MAERQVLSLWTERTLEKQVRMKPPKIDQEHNAIDRRINELPIQEQRTNLYTISTTIATLNVNCKNVKNKCLRGLIQMNLHPRGEREGVY